MCNGIGFALGPAVGGILFEWGGFIVPFLFQGGSILASILVAAPVMANTSFNNSVTQPGRGIVQFITTPSVLINYVAIVIQFSFCVYLYANLGEYLRSEVVCNYFVHIV